MSDPAAVLHTACAQAGLDSCAVTLIRASENSLYRLPGGIVARVSRDGQADTARKEVLVSRWLHRAGVPVVEAMPDIEQPVVVDGRAVTFWRELPAHREGSLDQVADALRQLHQLQPPRELHLPPLAPFVRLHQRIAEATVLTGDDRTWLLEHLRRLRQQFERLPAGLPIGAVHGDAWGGNIVDTGVGPVVLDLERFAYGPPEWDLTSIAVDYGTFGCMTDEQWKRFCDRYGYDVTQWIGYEVLRDARELRKVTFAAQMATQYPHLKDQALYRLACIRDQHGPRPWHWKPVP